MTTKKSTTSNVESLITMLAEKDGMVRLKARTTLVALGKPVVPSLNRALQNSSSDQVRWEAAKALGAIGDLRSIRSLVNALSDGNDDVVWLAAEALRDFKVKAWPPLLRAVMKGGSAPGHLYQGAHHVLEHQKEDGYEELLATLMQALDRGALSESAMVAAREILKKMKATS